MKIFLQFPEGFIEDCIDLFLLNLAEYLGVILLNVAVINVAFYVLPTEMKRI